MKSEVIDLVTQYKDGVTIKEQTVTIFAKRKSVAYGEFYAAYGVGIKPKTIFLIHPTEYYLADYAGKHATHIRYKDVLYPIIRAYEKDIYTMELTVG